MTEPSSTFDAGDLERPLDYISGQCTRLVALCDVMDRIGEGEADLQDWRRVEAAFRKAFPLQFLDEGEDLLPLLHARSRRGGDLRQVITTLTCHHVNGRKRIAQLLPLLDPDRIQEQLRLSPSAVWEIKAFAAQQRQHLAVLKAVVLPIARVRLTKRDLAALRTGMMRRRESQWDY